MPLSPLDILTARFQTAIREAIPSAPDPFDPAITPSRQPKFGDFQCNAAMALGKRLGLKPREVAQKIIEAADLGDLAEPLTEASIAGPGFINVTLRAEALADLLNQLDAPQLGIDTPKDPETVVVDLCGVNLAKQMHVGHIRSTVIGDAVARTLERLGHSVIRQNHVGDWGLQIGMVVWKLAELAPSGSPPALDLAAIEKLYRAAQLECAADRRGLEAAKRWQHPKALAELEEQVTGADEAMTEAKAWLVKLQQGDARALELWGFIRDVTMTACLENCRRLMTAITDKDSAGESSYAGELDGIVKDLESRGVAEHSDGMLVVRIEEAGVNEPCLVRKSDGGYLYATTDLAAIRHRVQSLNADRAIYCVDARQSLHFRQVFAAATKAGYATREAKTAQLSHAAFGTILGEDNKPFKTRSGENVVLGKLLDEAEDRAITIVKEKNPELEGLEDVAKSVAVAAIKYADLSNERIKDYVFSFDRMLAFEGNTGPYLLYALVRLKNIPRRAAEQAVDVAAETSSSHFAIAEPDEKKLALELLRYPAAVASVGESLEPHRLCTYLYDLATAFSGFYDRCPVLKADPEVRGPRLKLCDLTRRTLQDGLNTLGLPTVDRM